MYGEDCGGDDRLKELRALIEKNSKRTNVIYLVLDGHCVDDLDPDDHGHDLKQHAFDDSSFIDRVLLQSMNGEACKRASDLNVSHDADHEREVNAVDDCHSMNGDCHLDHDYGWSSTEPDGVHDDPDWLPSPDGCHSMSVASQPRRPVLR